MSEIYSLIQESTDWSLKFSVSSSASEHPFPGHSKSLLSVSYNHLIAFYKVESAANSIDFTSVTKFLSSFWFLKSLTTKRWHLTFLEEISSKLTDKTWKYFEPICCNWSRKLVWSVSILLAFWNKYRNSIVSRLIGSKRNPAVFLRTYLFLFLLLVWTLRKQTFQIIWNSLRSKLIILK